MTFKDFNTVNASEGVQTLFVYSNEVTGGVFSAMLLMTIFVIILLGTFFSAKRIGGGDGNFPASFAVAGFITATVAIVMSFTEGLMNLTTLTVAIVISIMGVVWLFFANQS